MKKSDHVVDATKMVEMNDRRAYQRQYKAKRKRNGTWNKGDTTGQWRRWAQRHGDHYRAWLKKQRDELSHHYVCTQLLQGAVALRSADLPSLLVDAKRAQLKAWRASK